MRWFLRAVLIVVAVSSSGCAIIDNELNNRGGYLDYVADEHWFKADSKKMRTLRAFALEASLARLATVTPKNDSDRKLIASRIGDASQRGYLVAQCAFFQNPISISNSIAPPLKELQAEPCFFFDSLMVDYTSALFDLAMIVLPVDDVKKLLDIATGGITGGLTPVAAIDLLNSLIQLAKDALQYGRAVGAIYRDTIELEVQVWLASPDAIKGIPASSYGLIPSSFLVTEEDVAPLRALYLRGNDDLRSWKAQIAALTAKGLEPVPDPKFIKELLFLTWYSCTLITSDKSSLAVCQDNQRTPGSSNALTLLNRNAFALWKAQRTSPFLARGSSTKLRASLAPALTTAAPTSH